MIKFDDSLTEQEAVAVVREFVWNDDKSADFLDYVNSKKIVSVMFSLQWSRCQEAQEAFMYSFLKNFGIRARAKNYTRRNLITVVLCYTIGDWLYFMRDGDGSRCKYRVPWDYVEFDDEGVMIFHEKSLD